MRKVFGLAGVAAILISASACATAKPTHNHGGRVSADPVVAAERAFAARHKQVSVKESFLEYSAADGVALTPGGVKNVKDFVGSWPNESDAGYIQWWPTMAGIARSGDLGFTTGPAIYGGGKAYSEYFTVWKKQPDGSWKWMIDQGTRPRKTASESATDVFTVPVSSVKPMDADKAWADLKAVDAALDQAKFADAATAEHYAPEIRLLGYQGLPVNGIEAARATLAARPGDLKMQTDGGGVSAAGDLGYTYGSATWTDDKGAAKKGPFLRVWQRRAQGWMVLVENISVFPG